MLTFVDNSLRVLVLP